MNLYAKLLERKDKPLRIGVIGAGKFGAMYIAQVPSTPGVHLVGIADLSPDNAREQPRARRLAAGAYAARLARCGAQGKAQRISGEDWQALVAHPGDRHHHRVRPATRPRRSSTRWPLSATASTSSWSRSRPTRSAGRCSRARPPRRAWSTASPTATSRRSICDLVDWARAAGFPVVAAGPRPQVAAALRAIDARHGVGLLRPHAGAGAGGRAQPEDVQLVPRRLKARDRDHGGVQRHRTHAGAGRPRVSRRRRSTRSPR